MLTSLTPNHTRKALLADVHCATAGCGTLAIIELVNVVAYTLKRFVVVVATTRAVSFDLDLLK